VSEVFTLGEIRKEVFSLGQVLTVSTSKMLCEKMGDLYGIMNFLTGDDLFTHQLVRAFKPCKKYVLEQYPGLAGVDTSSVTPDNYKEWLSEQVSVYGEVFQLSPMPEGYYEHKDPLSELAEMVPPEKIIVLKEE
jgi:hypothetical protein